MSFRIARLGLALGLLVVGCSSPPAPQGGERQDCYPNGTCNAGLTCASGVCVSLSDGGSGDGGSHDAGSDTAVDGNTGLDTGIDMDVGVTLDDGGADDTGLDGGSDLDAPTSDDASSDTGADAGTSTTDAFVPPDAGNDAGPRCGDGTRDPGEQCDDGNVRTLDGCDARCRYEVITRLTSVAISASAAPAACTPTTNALGTSVIANSTALGQLNAPIQSAISSGALNVLVQALGLDDLLGNTDPTLELGVMGASLDPMRGSWPGSNPIDWWFLADHSTVGAGGLPASPFSAALTAHSLTAGPTMISLPLMLGSDSLALTMTNARLFATINVSPPADHPAAPPTSLDPATLVFQTITASGTGQGLCGNITVQSLAQIPVPQQLTTGATACAACGGSHTYTYCGLGSPVGPGCNSLLDVFVGGCAVTPVFGACLIAAIRPTQPDVAGASGTVRPLVLDTSNKVSTDLVGDQDAYSSYFTFDANRAHATSETCAVSMDCQPGLSCTSGACR